MKWTEKYENVTIYSASKNVSLEQKSALNQEKIITYLTYKSEICVAFIDHIQLYAHLYVLYDNATVYGER